jgi:hypothetical protein
VKNVASDKEELKEPLTEQGCLLAFLLFGDSFITPLLYILIYFIQDINVYNLDSYIIFCQLALQEVQFREILLGLIGY